MSLRDEARAREVAAKLEGRYDPSFHLHGQHDQSTHGRGGGGKLASKGSMSPERKATLKKIAIGVGIAAVAAGLLFVAYKKAPGSVPGSEASLHSRKLEGLLEEGGPDLEKAIADRRWNLVNGKLKDRDKNSRDLAVLANKEFIHQDDAAGFLKGLNKTKYSQDEVDAMWEYAGVHRNPASMEGDVVKGAFKWQGKFRMGQKFNEEQQKMVDTLDGAISKNTLPRDVKLFRGVPATEGEFEKWSKITPGSVIRDKAPIFTGLTEARARPHYIDDVKPTSEKYNPSRTKSVLFEIQAPKGLPAVSSPYGHGLKSKRIPIPATVDIMGRKVKIPKYQKLSVRAPWLKHVNKEELVLRRSQPLRVLSTSVRADGVLVVKVAADIVDTNPEPEKTGVFR